MKHHTWTEITPEVARRLWKTHGIFAYNESTKVDWQLNYDKDACACEIEKAVNDGCIIFVERSE